MGKNLSQLMETDPDDRSEWMIAVEAIVAVNEDPENQHRVKVVIPSIDENVVCDEWAKQLVVYVGPPGYGSFFVPEIGSEVVLFGRLGQKHTLYYTPVFNEDFIVPPDFDTPAKVGFRVPGDFRIICDGDLFLSAGGIQIECTGALNIIAKGGVFINERPY
jgi:hypothetical protein